jgi:hypothetical protein
MVSNIYFSYIIMYCVAISQIHLNQLYHLNIVFQWTLLPLKLNNEATMTNEFLTSDYFAEVKSQTRNHSYEVKNKLFYVYRT